MDVDAGYNLPHREDEVTEVINQSHHYNFAVLFGFVTTNLLPPPRNKSLRFRDFVVCQTTPLTKMKSLSVPILILDYSH